MNIGRENEKREIMVSVYLLTYNHAQYIRDTFEGILMQKTNFAYEIFVFDDASTDGTSDIVREYAEKYPDIVIPYIQEKNTYGKPGRMETRNNLFRNIMRGKYMAFCEGDDYWIDENKLQIQVDYMETHPECHLTSHNNYLYNWRTKEKKISNPYLEEREILPEEIIMRERGNLATASLMIYREDIPEDILFKEAGIGDWPQQLYSVTKGTSYYFDKPMSVYRWNVENSWTDTMLSNGKKHVLYCIKMVRFFLKYNLYTNFKYERYIKLALSKYLFVILQLENGLNFLQELLMSEKELTAYIELIQLNINKIKDIQTGRKIPRKLKEYIGSHKKIYLYGAGKYANTLADAFEKHNINYNGFIETEKTKDYFAEHEVFSLTDVIEKEKDLGLLLQQVFGIGVL